MGKKITQLALLEKAKLHRDEYVAKDIPISCGILWGGDKETGKLYHAYCEWSDDPCFPHPHHRHFLEKEDETNDVHSGFFEDCIQGHNAKNENANVARKQGWIIGRGKYIDYAICPMCVKRLREEH